MKHVSMRRIGIGIAAASLLLLSACGGSDSTPTGNNSKGSISAKVDGSAWSATTVQGTWSNGVLGFAGSQIIGAENKQINIAGPIAKAGTYQIGLLTGITATYAEGSGAGVKTFAAQSGTLKVDELTTSGAKGTFTAEVAEQQLVGGTTGTKRSITAGTFDVKF